MSEYRQRTPEDGHVPSCLGAAVVAVISCEVASLAIQLDDYEMYGYKSREAAQSANQTGFTVWLQNNGPLELARIQLANGTQRCYCPPIKAD